MLELKNVFLKKEFQDFDFGTGVWPVVNPNVEIKMNDGRYINTFKKDISDFTDEEIKALQETNCIFSQKNEYFLSKKFFSEIPQMRYNSRIGYYMNLYVGHVNEGNYRENASSGGFGTWIFKELLDKNFIDGVIHVKEDTSKERLFKYDISTNINEVQEGSKTKYYPVEMSQVLDIVRRTPGRYAVIGVPSFIMELRLLCEKEQVFKDRIKFFIGLVCGHQKSSHFSDFLAWQCGIEPDNLEYINFRKKNINLPATSYDIEVRGKIHGNDKTVIKNTRDLYGYDWGQGFFKVKCSDFTDDVMNETADLTLGDAWLPGYADDSLGNNILIVRNPVIDNLIKTAAQEERISIESVDESTIINSQSGHFKHTQDEISYRLEKKVKKGEWIPNKRWYKSKKISFMRKRVQDLRCMICDYAPIYFEEAKKKGDFNYFKNKMNILVIMYNTLYLNQRIKRSLRKIKRLAQNKFTK